MIWFGAPGLLRSLDSAADQVTVIAILTIPLVVVSYFVRDWRVIALQSLLLGMAASYTLTLVGAAPLVLCHALAMWAITSLLRPLGLPRSPADEPPWPAESSPPLQARSGSAKPPPEAGLADPKPVESSPSKHQAAPNS